jgi:hypothetical protein
LLLLHRRPDELGHGWRGRLPLGFGRKLTVSSINGASITTWRINRRAGFRRCQGESLQKPIRLPLVDTADRLQAPHRELRDGRDQILSTEAEPSPVMQPGHGPLTRL